MFGNSQEKAGAAGAAPTETDSAALKARVDELEQLLGPAAERRRQAVMRADGARFRLGNAERALAEFEVEADATQAPHAATRQAYQAADRVVGDVASQLRRLQGELKEAERAREALRVQIIDLDRVERRLNEERSRLNVARIEAAHVLAKAEREVERTLGVPGAA